MATEFTPLVQGQKIRIDAHKRGAGVPNDWTNPGVHIHKTCNKGGDEFAIIIPLNDDLPPEIKRRNKKYKIDELDSKVRKEIHDVFAQDSCRKKFLEEVYANIQKNFNWKRNRRDIDAIAKKIGAVFGLSLVGTPIITACGNQILCYIQNMKLSDDSSKYMIVFNLSKGYVRIGEQESDDICIHVNLE